MNRMYRENRKSINAFVGCRHGCVYCKPSFQRQAKRQRKNCQLCYDYDPHSHLERLNRAPPKTVDGEFIFFPSMGDLAFATTVIMHEHFDYARKFPNTTFLMQSKDPKCFEGYIYLPHNIILATTIETNLLRFNTPSKYRWYHHISNAPHPRKRLRDFQKIGHHRKIVTIEPILDFILEEFVDKLRDVVPEAVYVGYDNHKCKLPEPPLAETMNLISELEKFTEVRVKSLRKAWYEK